MSFSRWFVLTTGIIWTGYGVACAIFPQIIGPLTGIGIDNWPADVEVRAWYLVTELGLGILAFYGWKDPERYLEHQPAHLDRHLHDPRRLSVHRHVGQRRLLCAPARSPVPAVQLPHRDGISVRAALDVDLRLPVAASRLDPGWTRRRDAVTVNGRALKGWGPCGLLSAYGESPRGASASSVKSLILRLPKQPRCPARRLFISMDVVAAALVLPTPGIEHVRRCAVSDQRADADQA